MTDAAGAVVGTWDFTAYGEVAASSGDASASRFLFAGEFRDDTGLYYLRARYLDPGTGQFLTVDPALASTGMAYAYTAGDPLQQVDPMGLDSSDSGGGQGVLAGIGNGLKSIGSGIAYGVNPAHWDDIKTSLQCGAEANGGGFGGWFTATTVQLNPMYAVIDNGDLAIQAGKDGRWGDAAERGTVAVGIFALTVAPIKIPIPKIVAGTLRGVAAVVQKIHLPSTAVTVLKGAALKVGKLEGLVGGKPSRLIEGSNGALRDPATGQFAKNPATAARAPASSGSMHGNSKASPALTHLYRLTDASGNLVKWGITADLKSRYSSAFLQGKMMTPMTSGARSNMLPLERWIVERDPGPLNLEPWAGAFS